MEEESEFLKLSVEDRIQHKLWKARLSGYEEATKLFGQWDDDDPNWKKYLGLPKKMVTDSNAVAQEKGLECCLAFAENCKQAPKTAGEVIEGLVTKCVAAPKTKTKELATQICLMYCEIEAHEKVVEMLLGGLTQKNPKVVSGCIYNVTECLRNFGAKVVKISPLLKAVMPLLDHRDKDVREQGKRLIIESYRWIGEIMKSQLTGLKPVQLTELENEFGNLEDVGRARAERWLRSAGPPKQEKADSGGGGDDDGGEEEEEDSQESALDPYELMDPVEILSKLPKNFYEQVEEKKWQLRKESLDALLPLTQYPKLSPGDFHDLVKVLKKFISKDTNVMLVAQAAQCLAGLAKGLRSHFKQFASSCLPVILEKFKEKKLNVVTALRECADAIYPVMGAEAIQEDCLASLKHKTPTVKSETASFMARSFAKCPPILTTNKKILKGYVSALLDTLNDSDGGVREASAEALGTLLKFLGEAKVMPFMPDLDQLKMDKIKEKAEKVELSGKSAAPKVAKPAKPAASSGPKVVKPASAGGSSSGPSAGQTKSAPPANKKVVKSGGASAASKKPSSAKAGGGSGSGGGSAGSGPAKIPMESDISLEEAEARVDEVFSASILSGLGDPNWKNRLAAMEEAQTKLESAGSGVPALVAVKLLARKPGLKDNNFQVLKLRLNALSTIAKNAPWTQQCWDAVTPEIVDKLADKKNVDACKEALYCMAESSSFNFIFGNVLDAAFAQKSPIVKAEGLNWATEGIKLFGFSGLQPKPALEAIKKGLSETNPTVRTGSIALLGVVHWHMGPAARRMFEDEKPAVLQQIDAECDKYKGQPVPAPVRGGKAKSGGSEGGDGADDGDDGDAGEDKQNMEDLVPRENIAPKITDELCAMIQDKNWKLRKEGLDKLKEIVSSAKFITKDLGSLPAALAPRTTDINKNLAIQALEMVGDLVLAMGPHSKIQIPALFPAVLGALADSKPNVRQAALATMKIFLQETSMRDLVVNDIFPTVLAKGNPFLKQEIFQWLAENLPESKGVSKEELTGCLPVLYSGVEDRSADVRKASQDAIQGFMKHIGYDAMRKATEKLSAVSKNNVMPLLDKARAALPPPPARQPAGKPAVKSAGSRPGQSKIGGGGKSASAAASEDKSGVQDDTSSSSSARPKPGSGRPGGRPGLAKPGAGGTKKPSAGDEEDSSPPYQPNAKLKQTRFRDEAKLKILKWNFTVPRQEFIDQLKDQMATANFNKSIQAMMFHADFKQHLKALDMLIAYVGSDYEGLTSNLDLLLKWMTLRFFDTNPSVNLKGLEYLILVFQTVTQGEEQFKLHDIEAASFLPFLVTKMGDPKDQIRSSCRTIMRLICQLYPASKMFNFVMNGIGTKNAKQRAECLDEVGNLIRVNGIHVCGLQPAQALKEVAKQIGDRDTLVRNAALNAVTEAYFKEGEKLYKMIGSLPEKDMAMLEERIKRSSKNRPLSSVGQPNNDHQQMNSHDVMSGQQQPASAQKSGSAPASGLRMPSSHSMQAPQSQASADYRSRLQFGGGGHDNSRIASVTVDRVHGVDEKTFQLDWDMLKAKHPPVPYPEPPKLIEHPDLEELLNYKPKLPVSRYMEEKREHQVLEEKISQIISPDPKVSISALSYLMEIINNDDKAASRLKIGVDQLFSNCSMQINCILQSKMRSGVAEEKMRSLKQLHFIVNLLVIAYSHQAIVQPASMQALHDLTHNIIITLLDPAVLEIPDNKDLIRALNLLSLKIVERSDHSKVAEALVKLLHESIGSTTLSSKYCNLVMKCIWKMTKLLPTWVENMNILPLINATHLFFKAFPSSYWKKVEDDTPNRTMKTVVHTLVTVKGESILNYELRLVDGDESSQLFVYIKKILAGGVEKKKDSGSSGGSAGSRQVEKPRSSGSHRISKQDHDKLVDIFKKIGQKELSKIGLQELYNFRKENPQANIEPFLSESSEYFRDYIYRGLRAIENEVKNRERLAANEGNTQNAINNNQYASGGAKAGILSDSNNTGQPAAGEEDVWFQHTIERLKRLRAAAGLDQNNQENVENFANSHSSE